MKQLFCLAALAASVLGYSYTAQAAGVEFSVGHSSQSTMTYRLGLKSNWDKSWLQSDVGRLTGYWDGAYTYWDGDKSSSASSLTFSRMTGTRCPAPPLSPEWTCSPLHPCLTGKTNRSQKQERNITFPWKT